MPNSSVFPIRGAVALALTAAGTALVIGFQPPGAAIGSSLPAGALGGAPGTASRTATPTPGATARPGSAGTTPPPPAATNAPAATNPPAVNKAPAAPTAAPTTAAGGGSGGLKNGTFTGDPAQDPFGAIQVAVRISAGRITDVQTVAQPGDHHSLRINTIALPMLHDQAISAQSAQIDGVSGATWTSQAYAQSLQSALDQAKG